MFQVNPMKNQALFSLKDKSKKLKCRLLQFLSGALRVLTGRTVTPGWLMRSEDSYFRQIRRKTTLRISNLIILLHSTPSNLSEFLITLQTLVFLLVEKKTDKVIESIQNLCCKTSFETMDTSKDQSIERKDHLNDMSGKLNVCPVVIATLVTQAKPMRMRNL